MTTYKTSEWVSPGHPDKVADYISEYILDRFIERDPFTRYALEVQIKDYHVSLAGEVTSCAEANEQSIKKWVKQAINKIGYTKEYAKRFGPDKAICGDKVKADMYISRQSPDISQGVNTDAWGDQGIFFGYFCRETDKGHGIDYDMARKIGMYFYNVAKKMEKPIGLDIKTQVTISMEDTGEYEVKEIIVAIPTIEDEISNSQLRNYVKKTIKEMFPAADEAKIIVNGTGSYHIHGPIGDSGTTGRKLAVDFYGSRSRIGGGSPWTKDGTKADLTLNIFAYEMAKRYYEDLKADINGLHHVETELSCCIGQRAVRMFVTAYDENGVPMYQTIEEENIKPSVLINKYHLNEPRYADMCINGLFSVVE